MVRVSIILASDCVLYMILSTNSVIIFADKSLSLCACKLTITLYKSHGLINVWEILKVILFIPVVHIGVSL